MQSLLDKWWGKDSFACDSCGKQGAVSWCSGCMGAVYCGGACQSAHFSQHSLICGQNDFDVLPADVLAHLLDYVDGIDLANFASTTRNNMQAVRVKIMQKRWWQIPDDITPQSYARLSAIVRKISVKTIGVLEKFDWPLVTHIKIETVSAKEFLVNWGNRFPGLKELSLQKIEGQWMKHTPFLTSLPAVESLSLSFVPKTRIDLYELWVLTDCTRLEILNDETTLTGLRLPPALEEFTCEAYIHEKQDFPLTLTKWINRQRVLPLEYPLPSTLVHYEGGWTTQLQKGIPPGLRVLKIVGTTKLHRLSIRLPDTLEELTLWNSGISLQFLEIPSFPKGLRLLRLNMVIVENNPLLVAPNLEVLEIAGETRLRFGHVPFLKCMDASFDPAPPEWGMEDVFALFPRVEKLTFSNIFTGTLRTSQLHRTIKELNVTDIGLVEFDAPLPFNMELFSIYSGREVKGAIGGPLPYNMRYFSVRCGRGYLDFTGLLQLPSEGFRFNVEARNFKLPSQKPALWGTNLYSYEVRNIK